jgi:hypothetical protein
MKKAIFIAFMALTLGSIVSSCSNKICPAYASYPLGRR